MKAKGIVSACAAAAMLWAGQASAAVLLSDNFDTETQSLNYTNFANWNVTGGSVDLIGTGFYDFYPGNGNYVDLSGSTNTGGTLSSKQSFSLAPGESMLLQFDLGGSTRGNNNTVGISLAGISLATLTLASSDPLAAHTYTLTNTFGSLLTGSLSFQNLTNGTQGAILDNVVLSSVEGGEVPEPSTLALLGLGLGTLVLRRRNRVF